MRVLLVYPETPETFWSFKHVLRLVSKRAAFPPLGLLTVAGMLPRDWELKLVDMNVERLTDQDLRWADYVFLSAMIVQKDSVLGVAERCRALKKPVVAGGPLFTTGHEAFPQIGHFVLGEAEELIDGLVSDMMRGQVRPVYKTEGWPALTSVAVPRWDLVKLRHYATMAVQFSRGCPYNCEFCDIIVMNGRVPRLKSCAQVLAELEALGDRGWKDTVFVVDDNFIGNKAQTKILLKELIEWRARTKSGMSFITEASVNLAEDAELCRLMVQSGFKRVFVGIETPSNEGLEECRKVQNANRDLVRAVQVIQGFGMEVMGGFIVGFDSDGRDVFKRQFEFIQKSGVVTAMVGLLTALPQTRLYQRLLKEGRLLGQATGNNTHATLNFHPRLNREFLINGYRDLMKRLYEPRAYYQRIRVFLKNHRPCGQLGRLNRADIEALIKSFWVLGLRHRGRWAYWKFCLTTLISRPRQFRWAIELAIMGYHFRRVANLL